jgi:hypothetical protein
VHAEEAEVVAGAQAGHEAVLFGERRCRFLQHMLDGGESSACRHKRAADGAVVLELALVGRLDGGDGAGFRLGGIEKLACAALGRLGNVEVVADLEEKRLVADELAAAEHGVAVAKRCGLFDERQLGGVGCEDARVGVAVAFGVDEPDLFDAGGEHLVEDDGECGFLGAVAIGEGLEREAALGRAGGGDEGLRDAEGHGGMVVGRKPDVAGGRKRLNRGDGKVLCHGAGARIEGLGGLRHGRTGGALRQSGRRSSGRPQSRHFAPSARKQLIGSPSPASRR